MREKCSTDVTDEWLTEWNALLDRYEIVPVEYGHWIDSRLYKGRELTTKESCSLLLRDIKIAHKLGFPVMRTKMGVIDDEEVNPFLEMMFGRLHSTRKLLLVR